jgi:tetratricopeptide (TPR) repeat protein
MLCTDLSELRPVVAAAYRTLAMNALQKGKYEKAVAYSSRGLTAWPEDPMGYNERGAAYSQQDQFEKAIADYSRAIQLEPRLPLPYRNRASAYIHLARYRDAVADCTKAIELAPGYQSAYRTRSQAYAKLKMKKEAESDDRTLAALTNPPPNKIEWKGTTVRGHPNLPNTSGQADGYVDAHTPDGRSVRLRPPTAGDSYYRGPDGKRYIIIRPNNLPDMSGMPDLKDYPGLKNYPGSR